MSTSSEDGVADPTSGGTSSTNGSAQQSGLSKGGDDKVPAPAEKTISCVSCRKRKLKCDRVKPKCGTCSRLRHECEYPERRRNLGSKRRNMKELEARLAQVETQLVSETKGTSANPQRSAQPDWNNFATDMNVNIGDEGLMDASFDITQADFGFQATGPSLLGGDFFSHEVISLGLQEPLPPQDMMEDLHRIYFEKLHSTMPMLHKYRYFAALDRPAHMRPPICLRYALWATVASVSDKYLSYEDIFYERARRYIEAAEMKSHGETFVTIYHAQTWGLIATYEAKKAYFSRAWMSTGRMVRLTHMLGLHRLDADSEQMKQILPPPKDWIELEERRRTFWAAFYGDRWASSGTGWPMIIEENEILTNLPSSEEAFEQGVMQNTISLAEALTGEGASKISPFGGVVLSACLFGHNFQHLHRTGPNERPNDLASGEFWKRHRQMDNVLSNTFMFLPDHLRLPGGLRDMNVVFLHMNIHASTICLHQAAVLTAERNKIDPSFIRQSKARSLMAAEEITNIMRLVSHLNASNMNSWMGFCLYVAGGVFIQDQKSDRRNANSMANLEFLLAAMRAIGNRHSITKHFTAQLELDIEGSGIIRPISAVCSTGVGLPNHRVPNTPLNGLLAERQGAPMTVENLQDFAKAAQAPQFNQFGKEQASFLIKNHPLTPFYVVPASSQNVSPNDSPGATLPNWNPESTTPLEKQKSQGAQGTDPQQQAYNESQTFAATLNTPNGWAVDPGFAAENTPSSDSSSSNTMQYPYRQADTSNLNKPSDVNMFQFQSGLESFNIPPDWTLTQDVPGEFENTQVGDELNIFLEHGTWNNTPPGP